MEVISRHKYGLSTTGGGGFEVGEGEAKILKCTQGKNYFIDVKGEIFKSFLALKNLFEIKTTMTWLSIKKSMH